MKKIYRSTTDQKIAGICGGLGEMFNIDPTVIRLL
nr:PspC domain-containing protein [Candidatus Neomarinimicrobiota bacterium]